MMKKRFLFLLLSALVYGGSAFADGETPEEETPTPPVTSLSIDDYGKLKTAVSSIKNAATWKEDLKTLTAELATSDREEPAVKYNKTSKLHDAITKFFGVMTSTTPEFDDTKISYTVGVTSIGSDELVFDENGVPNIITTYTNKYTLFVTIPDFLPSISSTDYKEKNGLDEWYSFKIKDAYNAWKSANSADKMPYLIYKNRSKPEYLTNTEKPTGIVLVYLVEDGKDEDGNTKFKVESTLLHDISSLSTTNRSFIYDATLLNQIYVASSNAYTNTPNYKQEYPDPANETDNYKDWKTKNGRIRSDLEETKKKLGDYATITTLNITEDITVTDDKLSTETWPAGYTLNGNDKQLINNSGKALFGTNSGDISNWISLDQSIASTNKGYVTDCIVKYSGGYRIYDDHGTVTTFDELEDAIYSVRETYGMNFSAEPKKNDEGKEIETKEEAIKRSVKKEVIPATKLYQAQYANAANKEVYDFKVNIKTTGLGYDEDRAENGGFANGELTLDNAVVYIDNTDANTSLTNVAVKKGSTYVCANAKLTETDKDNKYEFYVPFAFTATNLTYDRTVKTQYVSVCLPFALTAGKLKEMGAKAYTYAYVDDKTGKMKFSPISSVGANTPCILAFSSATEKQLFAKAVTSVTVASTKDADLTSGDSFYGNYKAYQTAAELAGDKAGEYVYGVQGDKFVKMSANSHMNAFRSFIVLNQDLVTGDARPFTITLLDEDGNEEVTGIELVSTTNSTNSDFKAVGGRNAIEITTGKACDVKVYTLNGALAKTARVEAGTTTLPMNAGMYVVNKTKVIVK